MNRNVINVVIVWAIIIAWGFMRGWRMSPPGYIAVMAALVITGYLIFNALKAKK